MRWNLMAEENKEVQNCKKKIKVRRLDWRVWHCRLDQPSGHDGAEEPGSHTVYTHYNTGQAWRVEGRQVRWPAITRRRGTGEPRWLAAAKCLDPTRSWQDKHKTLTTTWDCDVQVCSSLIEMCQVVRFCNLCTFTQKFCYCHFIHPGSELYVTCN